MHSQTLPNDRGAAAIQAGVVILAAGASRRMGTGASKALLELGGRSVLERSTAAVLAADSVKHVVIVTRPEDREAMEIALEAHRERIAAWAIGGAERTDSVRAGVHAMPDDVDVILVHDAARCFVEPEDVQRVAVAAYEHAAALLAGPVRDTLKASRNGFQSEESVDRESLWAAETPQGMRTARFLDVLGRAARDGFRATDDAGLHEHYHGPTRLVESHSRNVKITTPADVALGEALAAVLDSERAKGAAQ